MITMKYKLLKTGMALCLLALGTAVQAATFQVNM